MTHDEGTFQGNNDWTVPWQAGAGIELPASVPEYEAAEGDIETFRRDGVGRLKGVFADWVATLRRAPTRFGRGRRRRP